MNEDKVQAQRRQHEEDSTKQRAAILGIPYVDTRPFELELPLVKDLIQIPDMYRNYLIPLRVESGVYDFAVTTQTPQSLLHSMRREYNDRGDTIQFSMISSSAFKVFMNRFDPPKQIIYDDIEIAKEGDSETISSVSQTLNSVGTDQVFDYLIDQA